MHSMNSPGAGAGTGPAVLSGRTADNQTTPIPLPEMLSRLSPEVRLVPISPDDPTESVDLTLRPPHTPAPASSADSEQPDAKAAPRLEEGEEDEEVDIPFRFGGHSNGHGNICPIYGVLESADAYFVVQPFRRFTLQHVLMYDPGVIGDSHAKPLFIVYQILLALRSLHEQGIVHGVMLGVS
jgi:serine/threonine protein kinase